MKRKTEVERDYDEAREDVIKAQEACIEAILGARKACDEAKAKEKAYDKAAVLYIDAVKAKGKE